MRIALVASLTKAVPRSSMTEPSAWVQVQAGGRACCKGAGVLCLPVRSPILAAGLAVGSPQSLGRAGCRAGALSGIAFAPERAL